MPTERKRLPKRAVRDGKYWSGYVTQHSNALDLEPGVFTWGNPRRIALSLKRSAESSKRRRGRPFQSALSMLNFYINRAGTNLSANRRKILERAKVQLRSIFGRRENTKYRRRPRRHTR